MKYPNNDMEQMLEALKPLLERRDIIGYAAARNSRILRDELTEYAKVRDELVMKYGTPDTDEEGNPTGEVSLSFKSPDFPKFAEEIGRFATITHEPKLFLLKFEEAIGQLSGTELLAVEWMFED